MPRNSENLIYLDDIRTTEELFKRIDSVECCFNGDHHPVKYINTADNAKDPFLTSEKQLNKCVALGQGRVQWSMGDMYVYPEEYLENKNPRMSDWLNEVENLKAKAKKDGLID